MAVLGTLEYMIRVNTSELKSGITSSESQVKGYGNRLSTWAVAKGQMISRLAERAVSSVARFAKGSIVEAMSFDKAMSQYAATRGYSIEQLQDSESEASREFQQMSKYAQEMGKKTKYSATEAAEAMNYMALAGYEAETTMRMLPSVLNLAAAGNMELATASDMVTDAQTALGLSLSETETMIDQMAVASSKTNTSVAQLGEAILTVGGTAKDMKGGTQELTAVLGVLADNSVKGAEGGTALRNMLLSLQGKSSTAAKELKKLGISAYDTAGNLRSLPEIFADFNEAFSTSTMEERNSAFMKIFNARDLRSVNALLNTTQDRWKQIYGAIDDSDGAAKRMAETQMDNLSGDMDKFRNAMENAKITLSDVLEPALRKFVQNGTGIVQNLTDAFKEGGLSGAIQEAKRMLNGFITELQNSDDTRLQGLGNALGTIRDIYSWIKDNWQAVSTGIAAIVAAFAVAKVASFVSALNPLTLILSGIALAATWVITNWEGIKEDWNQLWTSLGDMVSTAWENVKLFFTNIIGQISEAWGTVSGWFEENVTTPISGFFTGLFDSIKQIWDGIKSAISNAWAVIAGWFETTVTTPLSTLFDSVFGVIQQIWDGIKNKISEAWSAVKGVLEPILKPIKDLFQGVVDVVSGIWDTLSNIFGLGDKDINVNVHYNEINAPKGGRGSFSGEYAYVSSSGSNPMTGRTEQLHAKGAWSIPYDDYPALLHRNEMVLTASQARQYREGNGGGVDYATIGTMIGEAIETAIGRVGVYMSGDRVADLTTRRLQGNINANNNARLRAMGG